MKPSPDASSSRLRRRDWLRVWQSDQRLFGPGRISARRALASVVWMAVLLGCLAALQGSKLGTFLVPPFAATLTIVLLLPDVGLAQPVAVVGGSTIGAGVGTIAALVLGHELWLAVLCPLVAIAIQVACGVYHPPGVALSIYPILLRPGPWFPLETVLPFTLVAVGSAAVLARLVGFWPSYPRSPRSTSPRSA